MRLANLADLITSDNAEGEPRPYVALEHVDGGTGRLLLSFEPGARSAPETGVAAVEPGDVLFGKLRPYLAKTWLADRPVYASTELLCLRPRPGVLSRWFAYLCASGPLIEWAVATSDGTKMPRTSWERLREFRVIVPTRDAQAAIVDYLDAETARIDALITKKRRLIELLREREDREVEVAALPHLNHSRRSSPSDVPLGNEVPSAWIVRPLGALLEWITYGFTNPMPVANEGPFMLTANDVFDGFIAYEGARHTTEDAFKHLLTDKSRPHVEDILLTKDGSLGRVALFKGPTSCINQSVALLRPKSNIIVPELLCELLRIPVYREALVFNAGGTTIKHLYISRVVKQRIALPNDRRGQEELLGSIHAIRTSCSAPSTRLGEQVELLMERRQALITAAVTGELDVAGAVA